MRNGVGIASAGGGILVSGVLTQLLGADGIADLLTRKGKQV